MTPQQQPSPVVIMLENGGIRVDGLPLSFAVLQELLRAIAHPDPRRWIRFERQNDNGMVYVKMEEQGPAMKCDTCKYITTVKGFAHCPLDGTTLTSAPEVSHGISGESVGSYGEETQNARNSSAPN